MFILITFNCIPKIWATNYVKISFLNYISFDLLYIKSKVHIHKFLSNPCCANRCQVSRPLLPTLVLSSLSPPPFAWSTTCRATIRPSPIQRATRPPSSGPPPTWGVPSARTAWTSLPRTERRRMSRWEWTWKLKFINLTSLYVIVWYIK